MAKSATLAVKVISDASGAVKGLEQTEQKVGALGKVGPVAAAGLAAGAAGLVALGAKAVSAASDLEQTNGAIEAVFGKAGDKMKGFAAQAATTVGLTKSSYQELATVLGSQLKNGGTPIDQLAGKTSGLITAGADLAAMFGGSTKDAVGALSSALKGERDPIEKYGVSLNQAKIDAKAAELGFKKVGGTLSSEANQAATLALIMDQTTAAHGAFGREADTLATRQQVLDAQLGNLSAQIGGALLPVISSAVGAFAGLAAELGPRLEPILATVSAALAGLGTGGLGPVASGFAGLQAAIAPVLPVFALIGAQILGLGSDLAAGLGPILASVANTLLPALGGAIAGIAPMIPPVLEAARGLAGVLIGILGKAVSALLPVIQTVFRVIVPIISNALGVIQGVIRTVTAVLSGDWAGAWEGIKQTVSSAWKLIQSIISGAIEGVRAQIGAFARIGGQIVDGLANSIRGSGDAVIRAATGVVSGALDAAKRFLGIRSPSRAWAEVGAQSVAGLVGALEGGRRDAARASAALVALPDADQWRLPGLDPAGRPAGRTGGAPAVQIIIQGALDPAAVARQIRDILNSDARIRGTVGLNGLVIA